MIFLLDSLLSEAGKKKKPSLFLTPKYRNRNEMSIRKMSAGWMRDE